MKEFTLISGAIFGALTVIIGAFGAHAFKDIFSEAQMKSFETGVKYQIYHGIMLVILGFQLNFDGTLEKMVTFCFVLGTLLFSFSIYGLNLSAAKGRKMRFLGPVTPLGGLLLLVGWIVLIFIFIQ